MSTFNKDDLTSLQKLSRIKLSSEKEGEVLENIKKILDFMDMLNEVNTESTAPLTHVVKGMKARLADDIISEHLEAEVFLKGAPDRVGAFLKVPVVIEDKEEI
jgi:aspartyl-tRNA(Asn)/glutamyl-tRNA(Gln) amidotransferase subunit C